MSKDFVQVYSSYTVSLSDKVNIPSEHMKRIVNRSLAEEIVRFIVNNIDAIPAEVTERIDETNGGTEHRIRLNIISDDEYRRLRTIERDYNRINSMLAKE